MFEDDAERRVFLRLQREEMTLFASKLALAEEAHTLDVEVRPWFKRTYAELQAEKAEIEEAIRALELVKTGKQPYRAYRRCRRSTRLAKTVEQGVRFALRIAIGCGYRLKSR